MIGITNRTFKERYIPSDHGLMTLLHTEQYESGADAREREKALQIQFADKLYVGPAH